jgi:uncharacterized protein (TIGR00369 family)
VIDEVVRGSIPPPGFYSLSGLEQARSFLRGLVPATPLARLVGYRLTQMGSGSATLTMPASPWLQFADGTVDIKILVEEALGVAVLTSAPGATRAVTTAMSMNHFRPSALESRSFVARARVLNSGSAFTVAEVVVEDALGRAIAHATASLLLRDIRPPPPPHRGFSPVDEPTYATPDPHLRPVPSGDFLFAGKAGLEGMRTLLGRTQSEPPITQLLGLRLIEVAEDGSGALSLPASPWFRSRWTDLQQGPIATAMQIGLSAAPLSLTKANEYVRVVGQSLTFLRPVAADGRDLLTRYRLVHRGDELLVSAVEVIDAGGNRVAMGSQTSMVGRRRRAGAASVQAPERVLATVMFTDIVASTRRAQQLGDERWRELLAEHDALVRRQLETFRGREVKTTGDGFLAAFESPAGAVQCARAIRDAVRQVGLEIRAGLHTGECEQLGSDLAGIAVHAASRIQGTAAPGEILVSSTVHDLVAGSGIAFSDRGLHELKDIDGKRQLFAVAG